MSPPRLMIWYHGTNAEAAQQIMREGFRPGTNFASHLEDALGYGGLHVFDVALREPRGEERWQWDCLEAVPPESIVRYRVVRPPAAVFENEQLNEYVFQEALTALKEGSP